MDTAKEMASWPDVPKAALQRWLDTGSPDYELRHWWGDDWEVCLHRRAGFAFAYERRSDQRCFVHPDFVSQVI